MDRLRPRGTWLLLPYTARHAGDSNDGSRRCRPILHDCTTKVAALVAQVCGFSIRAVASSYREPTMWSLLSVSDDRDHHTTITACIPSTDNKNSTRSNGENKPKKWMYKQEGGSATTAHRNDIAVDTTATKTRQGSSNNSGTLPHFPGKMK